MTYLRKVVGRQTPYATLQSGLDVVYMYIKDSLLVASEVW